MEFNWGLILGGFGLFMFGMKYMGDGLKSYCGSKMRDLIDRYTTNPLLGIFIGCVVTCIIQSSSATSVIVIGFVRAGLMKLEQAAGILLGASVGTTITAFLIGLKVEEYALYFVFVGGLMISFSKRKKNVYLGEIIFGFGCLFYGLKIMGEALATLVHTPLFQNFTVLTSNHPVLAFFAGLILTIILQSSSVCIGIIQKIYEAGGIAFLPTVLFVYAANIGTTITGIIASLGGSLSAKRTAWINTLFKVIVISFFTLTIYFYLKFINFLIVAFDLSPMMQIATVHMVMNVIGVFILFPFIPFVVKIIKKLIPGDDNSIVQVDVESIDENLALKSPFIALDVTKEQIKKFKDIVINNVCNTKKYLCDQKLNNDLKEIIISQESLINDTDAAISKNLRSISKAQLSEIDMTQYNLQSSIIKNYERIGDLALNLFEFYEMVYDGKEKLSSYACEEINIMYEIFIKMFELSNRIYFDQELTLFQELNELETKLDLEEYNARNSHFKRLGTNQCQSNIAGSVYCDILSNLERMGDHCMNIAKEVLKEARIK